jgi:UDP-hydrolysing UDP-N-acetyl-D-glucosamine 2-epimerase
MRKICFVITSFIHYSRNLLILDELNKREDVELHVVVGGSALLPKYTSRYADVRAMLEADGIVHIHELYFTLEGDNRVVKAKTAGLGIIEFATLFNDIAPDVVVVRGDRYEVLAAATAASYMNIPVAHIEGGDISGTLDENVRHAITKLSHLHIATNAAAEERLRRMGEDPHFIVNFGSPDVEVVDVFGNGNGNSVDLAQTGSGTPLDVGEDFMMVMYHPVWQDALEEGKLARQTRLVLEAVHALAMPAIWFWPNADVGSEEISHELRVFRDRTNEHKIHFMRYLPPRMFVKLLGKTRVLVGNSSAGIKESSFLGVPVVNIGRRQQGRLRAENVVDVEHDTLSITDAIRRQFAVGRFKPSAIYRGEETSRRIAEVLATAEISNDKRFFE